MRLPLGVIKGETLSNEELESLFLEGGDSYCVLTVLGVFLVGIIAFFAGMDKVFMLFEKLIAC